MSAQTVQICRELEVANFNSEWASPAMPEPILIVEDLSLWAAGKLVLKQATFNVSATGITALMGPVGTGKSTLLKWLCAKADPAAYRAEYARADYNGAPLVLQNAPPLYGQKQGHSIDQMMEALAAHLVENPSLICVDEATAGHSAEARAQIMAHLAHLAQSRAVLMITHNQEEARLYSSHVMLLAGGRLQEFTPTARFFEHPQTDAGQQFIRSGGVTMAGVETPGHHLCHTLRDVPFDLTVSEIGGGGRFCSIAEGRLFMLDAGADGAPVSEDVQRLQAAGVTCVVLSGDTMKAATASAFSKAGFAVLFDPGDPLRRGREIQRQLTARGPVAFYHMGQDPAVSQMIGQALISLSVPASKAAEVSGALRGLAALDPLEEQALWDFELALAVELDGETHPVTHQGSF